MANIPSYIDDPSYRYKMPKIQTRIEGRGNGIKTNMVNCVDVARALKTNPAYLTKYMGGELGALSNYHQEEEKSIVNGAHETSIAQQLVDKFIDKFILCHNCKLPEIDMAVKKGFLTAACKACGWSGDLDNGHKLVKFIIQNPPGSEAAGFTIAKKDRKTRQAERAGKKKKKDSDDEDDEDEDSDEEEAVDKKEKKKDKKEDKKEKKEKKEKKKEKKKDKKKKDGDDSDDDDGEVKEKKKKEKKEKKSKEGKEKKDKKKDKKKEKDSDDSDDDDSDKAKGTSKNNDDDLEYDDEIVKESIARLAKFTKGEEAKGKMGVEKFFDEARMIQIQNAYSPKIRLYVALESFFGDAIAADNCKARVGFIRKLISTPQMPPADILYAFEVYYKQNPTSVKKYAMVLKELYDADLVKEEQLLAHYGTDRTTDGFEAAKAAAKPFLEWLQKDDEESDDDSDDGSDDGSDVDVDDI